MKTTEVHTASNSVYTFIERDDGRFIVTGGNVVSSISGGLNGFWWEITRPEPWPPVLSEVLMFVSTLVDQKPGTKGRLPGGGKITSPIRM